MIEIDWGVLAIFVLFAAAPITIVAAMISTYED